MSLPKVRSVSGSSDHEVAINAITLGFVSDPVMRWAWPDPKAYLETMPKFSEAFGAKAFSNDTAHIVDEGKAAALWLPPGEQVDADPVVTVLTASMSSERLDEMLYILEEMENYHPDEDCWYLSIIAADANFMGQGLGAALMKHALREADEKGLPAYLESSNIRNVPFYERHGFEVMGEIQIGSSPIVRPMIRSPRP